MQNSKKVSVDYTARDFNTIKQRLVQYAKRYYPNKFQDFNEASFGSLVLDTVAYVGDMLSFYVDYQANESFLDTAVETNNIIKLAKQLGYKHEVLSPAIGVISIYMYVPSTADGLEPDIRYMPVLKKGSSFSSVNGVNFTLAEDVRFDKDENEVAAGIFDEVTGLPTFYAIKSYGVVISGQFISTQINVGEFQKFLKLRLPNNNIVEIISVTDSDGNEYYEVESLSQDFVYRTIDNVDKTDKQVSSLIRPYYVPRRYVVERDSLNTYLQFGYGNSESVLGNQGIADPSLVVLKQTAKEYITDSSFDPSRLVYNDKLGVVPENTTLTIKMRVLDTNNSSVSANSLTNVNTAIIKYKEENSLSQNVLSFIKNSMEITNEEPITVTPASVDSQQIKKIAYSTYNTQNRAVTREDYKSLIYRMPKKFGSVKRVNVLRDQNSYKRNLNVYIITQNEQNKLIKCSDSLKQNLKVWLSTNKMINDTIDIIDAKVINLGLDFQIVSEVKNNKEEVLSNCISNLKNWYTRTAEIGENFYISDVYKILRDTKGVLDVVDVRVNLKYGGAYSDIILDLDKLMSSDRRFIEIPDNVIYEIKYPNQDIRGVVV